MSASLSKSSAAKLRLSIPCELDRVRPMAQSVREFLAKQGHVSEEEIMSCELALVEACNNAVLYVTPKGKTQSIDVEIICGESQVQLRIDDHTAGFDLPEAAALPPAESESGRGIFLMQSMMDSVHYFKGETQNSLVMTKLRLDSHTGEKRFSSATLQEFSRKLVESEQIISDMAAELSSCYETLSAIFRCGAELGKTNDFKEFSRALCNDLLQITGADWYVLRIIPSEDGQLEFFVSSASTSAGTDAGLPSGKEASEAEIKAARTRQDFWFNLENPLHRAAPSGQTKPDAIGVVHPFLFAEKLMGTLTVGKSPEKPPFTSAQANVIHTFADFLAIQMVNARLQEDQLRSRITSRELEIAKTIQLALLPKALPNPKGYRLAGYCESARQVGGDFYDVVPVSDTSLLLIIADVMGKGIPAAMFAAILRSLLRATPEFIEQPAALLARVNRLLFDDLSEVEMFITAQLTYIDLDRRKIIAANAGHCPLLLGAPEMPCVKTISPDGIPLGILPNALFRDQEEDLLPNARLLLYTDGLTDAQNTAGQFFSEERLLKWFQRGIAENRSADELKASLVDELKKFQGLKSLYDDQTFLILAEDSERNHAGQNLIGG